MKFIVDKNNIETLTAAVEAAVASEAKVFRITVNGDLEMMPRFSDLISEVYKCLDYEKTLEIWLEDFPFCVFNDFSHDHVLNVELRMKNEECRKCKYMKLCSGFPKGYFEKYGEEEIKPITDKPIEVMIEVESRCNFQCEFCFNKISFAQHGRDIENLSFEYLKKVLENIKKAEIEIVRFTGGEPMLRPDIFELINYADGLGLKVWLNTNGSLITEEVVKKIADKIENVLIPIESCDSKEEEKITGYKNSLEKKIQAIKLLKKVKIPRVRVGTVISQKAIKNFDKFLKLILELEIDEWEFYYPVGGNIDSEKIEKLVDKIIAARKETKKEIIIANTLPFCAIKNPEKLNLISRGGIFDNGHSRVVIDPRGFVKPHYFVDKNIGDPMGIIRAWKSDYMQKLRNLEFLSEECQECNYKFKCRGKGN